MIRYSIFKERRKVRLINKLSNEEAIKYGWVDYIVDNEKDIFNLPTNIASGSRAIVAKTSHCYILNSLKNWVNIDYEEINQVVYNGGTI